MKNYQHQKFTVSDSFNLGESKQATINIDMSTDIWRLIFLYLDEPCTDVKNCPIILSYRLVSRKFAYLALEAIQTVKVRQQNNLKIGILLSRPSSVQNLEVILRQNFREFSHLYDLVGNCRKLSRLSITVFGSGNSNQSNGQQLLSSNGQQNPGSLSSVVGLDGSGLRYIGEKCRNISELNLHMCRAYELQDGMTEFLSAFPNLKSLCVRPVESCGFVDVRPPADFGSEQTSRHPSHWLARLESMDGNLLSQRRWRHAAACLPALKSLTWRCQVTDIHLKEFSLLCKGNPIAVQLEHLYLASEHQPAGDLEQDRTTFANTDPLDPSLLPHDLTDVGLSYALQTFRSLRYLSITNTQVSLTTPGIMAQISELTQLEELHFDLCAVLCQADRGRLDVWLTRSLPLFPRSLRSISMRACKVSMIR